MRLYEGGIPEEQSRSAAARERRPPCAASDSGSSIPELMCDAGVDHGDHLPGTGIIGTDLIGRGCRTAVAEEPAACFAQCSVRRETQSRILADTANEDGMRRHVFQDCGIGIAAIASHDQRTLSAAFIGVEIGAQARDLPCGAQGETGLAGLFAVLAICAGEAFVDGLGGVGQ